MAFTNQDPNHRRPSPAAALRRLLIDRGFRRKSRAPDGPPAPRVEPDWQAIHNGSEATRITWLGHASILLQIAGRNLLIDPVFSKKVGWLFSRHSPPAMRANQLPRIDLILVTHNHYDHLDAASIAAAPRTATIVVPSNLGKWFCRFGFARVIELNWWESATVDAIQVTCVPSRHWSRRSLFDMNRSLWGGFVIEAGPHRIYHAGDTARFDGFRQIGDRFPDIDVALLPIGGYDPQWFMQHNHFTPEQAGEAFVQLQARLFAPIHWGTFRLSDEPLLEPIERLHKWWQAQQQLNPGQLRAWSIGETLTLPNSTAE